MLYRALSWPVSIRKRECQHEAWIQGCLGTPQSLPHFEPLTGLREHLDCGSETH